MSDSDQRRSERDMNRDESEREDMADSTYGEDDANHRSRSEVGSVDTAQEGGSPWEKESRVTEIDDAPADPAKESRAGDADESSSDAEE